MRGETFVTRKITRAIGRIVNNLQSKVTLGNLEASRDWGFAGDYVEAMWLMMQQDNPDDWVIATGETHTVREFAEVAFKKVNLNYEDYIQISEKYFRPNEVDFLLGDSSKAKEKMNWKPKTSFNDLVELMVNHDIELAKQEKILIDEKLILPSWENPIS